MNGDIKTNNPNEVDSRKQEALDKLKMFENIYGDKLSYAALNGMKNAIDEYFSKEKEYSELGIKRGGNALDYFEYKSKEGKGLTDTNSIYNVKEAKTSDISMDKLYKMFAPQVVENILQNKPIVFPEKWDISAHYKETTQEAGHTYSGMPLKTIDDVSTTGERFKNSMADRIDLLANNASSESIGDIFSMDNQDKYKNKLSGSEYGYYAVNGWLLPNEKEAAKSFNTLLQKTTGSGRNLGGDIYADTKGNVLQGEGFKPMQDKLRNKDAYQRGVDAVRMIDLSKPANEQVIQIYGKLYPKGGTPDEAYSFKEGIYEQMAKQGEKVIRIKGEPQRVRKGTVGELYNSIQNERNQMSEFDREMYDSSLTHETKNLYKRFKYLNNVIGDASGVEDQIGKLWVAY